MQPTQYQDSTAHKYNSYRCFFPDLAEFRKYPLRRANISTLLTFYLQYSAKPAYWNSTLHIADFRLQETANFPSSTELFFIFFILIFCNKGWYSLFILWIFNYPFILAILFIFMTIKCIL